DRHAGVENVIKEGRGEWAVLARRPVERGALRIAGESDQRAARQIAVDPAQPPLAHDRPGLASRQRLGERIIAAGVEDDDIDPVLALHLLENKREADRAEV